MADKRFLTRFLRVIFDRDSAKKAQQELNQSFDEAGKKAGDGFLKALKATFDKQLADLKNKLASGLIDQKAFKQQQESLNKAFNTALAGRIDEFRKANKLTDAEYLKLSRQFKRTGEEGTKAWDSIGAGIKRAGAALASFFAVSKIMSFGKDLIRAAEEQERVNKRLEQQITNTGASYAAVRGEIQQTTKALRESHRITGGEVAEILQRLIAVTGNYQQSVKNVGLVADVAATFNKDYAAAADLVGKVLNGNLKPLKAIGITAKDSADGMRILRERTEGAAKASTTATQQLSKAWQDFKEEFGAALLDATRGRSIFDAITKGIISLTNNVGMLTDRLVALTKAIMVAGVFLAVQRLTAAIAAATAGATTFLTVLRGAAVMLGPTGWLVLGVAALSEAFFRAGEAARVAAEKALKARDDFRASLSGMTDDALKDEEAVLVTQLRALERERSSLQSKRSAPLGIGDKPTLAALKEQADRTQRLADIEKRLADIRERAAIIARERAGRTGQDAGGGGGGGGGAGDGGTKGDRDLERLQDDIRVKRMQVEQQVTRDFAEEQVRRQALLKQTAEVAQKDIASALAEIDRLNLLLAAGFDRDLIPKIQQTSHALGEVRTNLDATAQAAATAMAGAAEKQAELAEAFKTPWIDALGVIKHEVEGQGSLFYELGLAWAHGGFAGLAQLATFKVKENLARVIEETAKAVGSFALGNPAAAAAHLKSAAGHGAAAIAWKALGAATGGGSGAGAAGGAGVGGANAAARTQPAESEVHIYLTGPGFDALNPAVQKVVYGAMENARERYGNNVKVHTRRTG